MSGSSTLFAFETDSDVKKSKVHYKDQGDKSMYTAKKLKERKKIKSFSELIAVVNSFWHCFHKDIFVINNKDREGIPFASFMQVYLKIARLLHGREFSMHDAYKQGLADWKKDSERTLGMYMSKRDLHESLFELVDLWTISTLPGEYVGFLSKLFYRLTKTSSPLQVFKDFMKKNELEDLLPLMWRNHVATMQTFTNTNTERLQYIVIDSALKIIRPHTTNKDIVELFRKLSALQMEGTSIKVTQKQVREWKPLKNINPVGMKKKQKKNDLDMAKCVNMLSEDEQKLFLSCLDTDELMSVSQETNIVTNKDKEVPATTVKAIDAKTSKQRAEIEIATRALGGMRKKTISMKSKLLIKSVFSPPEPQKPIKPVISDETIAGETIIEENHPIPLADDEPKEDIKEEEKIEKKEERPAKIKKIQMNNGSPTKSTKSKLRKISSSPSKKTKKKVEEKEIDEEAELLKYEQEKAAFFAFLEDEEESMYIADHSAINMLEESLGAEEDSVPISGPLEEGIEKLENNIATESNTNEFLDIETNIDSDGKVVTPLVQGYHKEKDNINVPNNVVNRNTAIVSEKKKEPVIVETKSSTIRNKIATKMQRYLKSMEKKEEFKKPVVAKKKLRLYPKKKKKITEVLATEIKEYIKQDSVVEKEEKEENLNTLHEIQTHIDQILSPEQEDIVDKRSTEDREASDLEPHSENMINQLLEERNNETTENDFDARYSAQREIYETELFKDLSTFDADTISLALAPSVNSNETPVAKDDDDTNEITPDKKNSEPTFHQFSPQMVDVVLRLRREKELKQKVIAEAQSKKQQECYSKMSEKAREDAEILKRKLAEWNPRGDDDDEFTSEFSEYIWKKQKTKKKDETPFEESDQSDDDNELTQADYHEWSYDLYLKTVRSIGLFDSRITLSEATRKRLKTSFDLILRKRLAVLSSICPSVFSAYGEQAAQNKLIISLSKSFTFLPSSFDMKLTKVSSFNMKGFGERDRINLREPLKPSAIDSIDKPRIRKRPSTAGQRKPPKIMQRPSTASKIRNKRKSNGLIRPLSGSGISVHVSLKYQKEKSNSPRVNNNRTFLNSPFENSFLLKEVNRRMAQRKKKQHQPHVANSLDEFGFAPSEEPLKIEYYSARKETFSAPISKQIEEDNDDYIYVMKSRVKTQQPLTQSYSLSDIKQFRSSTQQISNDLSPSKKNTLYRAFDLPIRKQKGNFVDKQLETTATKEVKTPTKETKELLVEGDFFLKPARVTAGMYLHLNESRRLLRSASSTTIKNKRPASASTIRSTYSRR